MIVLSAGMQKAGTGWYFNMTNDLIVACGGHDVRGVRTIFGLEDVLKHHNCNLAIPNSENLLKLQQVHAAGHSFVIKSHGGPQPYQSLIAQKILRATYIYRDPRDVMLSAFDHGERIRSKGQHHTFGRLTTLNDALKFACSLLSVWEAWRNMDQVFMVRYEDLISDSAGTMLRLSQYLGLNPSPGVIEQIVSRFHARTVASDAHKTDYLHFNIGQIGRWKTLLDQWEVDRCNEAFGDRLQRMGYI